MRESTSAVPRELPDYLRDTYTWAYLDHRTLPWLDRPVVVSAILWGNAARLMSRAVSEFQPGQQVLQAAAVYGDFSPRLARQLGDSGELLVLDVAPIQIANTRRKLADRLHFLRLTQLLLAYSQLCVGTIAFLLITAVWVTNSRINADAQVPGPPGRCGPSSRISRRVTVPSRRPDRRRRSPGPSAPMTLATLKIHRPLSP